ncbi:MAG: ribosome maturation factor RimP [Bacteroidetes bacterium]|nr:ribosome maturation factor RimP [Bacteroidota bacterium]
MSSIPDKIHDLLLPITDQSNSYIVEIILRGERSSKVIEVYVDSDNGITLDECSQISRVLSEKLDEADLITGRYRLDVSSPGLDRPLKLLRQYAKNIGRTCKIKYTGEEKKKFVIEGKLDSVSEQTIIITKAGKQTAIAFSAVQEAYIIPKI